MTVPPRQPPGALTSAVPSHADGAQLLDYLCARFAYLPRDRWRDEIANGNVLVAGAKADATTRLRRGMDVTYLRPDPEPWVDDRIATLYEDAAVLVVDKPAHLPMHADGPFRQSTLVHLLQTRRAEPALGPCHRLDRETSGVVLLARNPLVRQSLQREFAAGAVTKTYLVLVRGVVAEDFLVDAPIGHAVGSAVTLRRSCAASCVDGKPARTRFGVVRKGARNTLLRAIPATGRTHQIRAHLEHAGFPVVGDKLYGRPDEDYLAFIATAKRTGDARAWQDGGPDRHLLHAESLTFRHPDDGLPRTVAAPMPQLFDDWLDRTPTPP
ncbi:MAG: RluA family pseudouridine synthase [Planctomycetota bacterium]